MAQNKVFTLKLLVNKATNKVLFAEAPKEVVDFLFGLLELPLGSVVKVLTSEHMVGSFGNLFQSVAALDATYLKSAHVRDNLLDPVVRSSASRQMLRLPPAATPSGSYAETEYYRCSNYNNCRSDYFSTAYGVICPKCKYEMTREFTFVGASGIAPRKQAEGQTEGYVKEVVTYTIMDDLTVTPMSTISGITLLNKYNVKDVGSLEERVVKLGFDQGLKLLQASLQSKTVLTDVFMPPDVEAAK